MECKQKAEGRMWPWAGETPVRTAAERNIQKAKGRYERGMVKGQIDRTSLKFSRPEISHLLSPAYRYFLTNTSPNHFRVHNLKFTSQASVIISGLSRERYRSKCGYFYKRERTPAASLSPRSMPVHISGATPRIFATLLRRTQRCVFCLGSPGAVSLTVDLELPRKKGGGGLCSRAT